MCLQVRALLDCYRLYPPNYHSASDPWLPAVLCAHGLWLLSSPHSCQVATEVSLGEDRNQPFHNGRCLGFLAGMGSK